MADNQEVKVIRVPLGLAAHPGRLFATVGWWLARYRTWYFLILPLSLGLALLATGSEPASAAAAAGLALVLGWLALTLHEFSHVAMVLYQSFGFAGVELHFHRGARPPFIEHARWLWSRLLDLAPPWLPVKPVPRRPLRAGYLFVVSDMMISARTKMRIALAGTVMPLVGWGALALLALPTALALDRGVEVVAVVLSAGAVYLVVYPLFSGVIYNGAAFSDFAYASNFVMRGIDYRTSGALRYLTRLAGRLAREIPGLVHDVGRYCLRPQRALKGLTITTKRPKRSCFSWCYQRDGGRLTNRVTILAPLGLGLLKTLTAMPQGRERELLAPLLASPEALAKVATFDRIFLIELSEIASRAWELFDGSRTLGDIAAQISLEKGLAFELVLAGLTEFLRDMHSKYLVNVNWPDLPSSEYPRLADVVFEFGNLSNLFRRMYGQPAAAPLAAPAS